MRLGALMEALERNQAGFAGMIELSQPALNNYLKGIRRPELDVAIRIASKTGVTLDWLYLGDRSGLPARMLDLLPDLSDRSRRAG
jgi:transcriptional regulator with XRE-family HTH domain